MNGGYVWISWVDDINLLNEAKFVAKTKILIYDVNLKVRYD